jgi:hypothetical protein
VDERLTEPEAVPESDTAMEVEGIRLTEAVPDEEGVTETEA